MKPIKLKCGATLEYFPEARGYKGQKEYDTFRVLAYDPFNSFSVATNREQATLSYDGNAARGDFACFFVRRSSIPGMIRALSRIYRAKRPPKED